MSTLDNTVSLKVGGQIHEGWQRVAIEMSLTECARSFDLAVTDRWPGQQASFQLVPGMSCALAIGDTKLVTGWVDDVEVSYDADSHSLALRGRGKTGDLADCSALSAQASWNGVSIETVAAQLLSPYGIKVTSTTSDTTKTMVGHMLQLGETVWECLDRAARQYGVTVIEDADGNLVLTRPGTGTALAEARLGGNILSASCTFSDRETFQDYYIRGQFPGGTEAYSDPRVNTQGIAHATDPTVTRYRPLIVEVECNTSDQSYLPTRAKWEAATRAGAARRATLSVAGWRDAAGQLYTPNSMISVQDDFLGIHESLLVVSVRLSLDDQSGEVAQLTLTRNEAFEPQPLGGLPFYENGAAAQK